VRLNVWRIFWYQLPIHIKDDVIGDLSIKLNESKSEFIEGI